jgi:hypothetical protein
MGTGCQIYIVASTTGQLRKRNTSPHDCSVFMIETEDISAILSCFEGIRGHWYTPAAASTSKCGEFLVECRRRVVRALEFARRSVGQTEDGTSCPCLRELVAPHSVSRPRRVDGPLITQFMALRVESMEKRTSSRRLQSATAGLCVESVERSGVKSQLPHTRK